MNVGPEVFGDFLLVQSLGRSQMAETFVAVRLGDRAARPMVLKRPRLGERPAGEAAEHIRREAEVLERVSSPFVVRLEAAGEIAGLPYVAVEHVRGLPLDSLLRHGALPLGACRAIGHDLAKALIAVHEAGYAHCDLAPPNVIVDELGEAKLIDFGAALPLLSQAPDIRGRPGYAAPECVARPIVSGATDVYGWGTVVGECLLGQPLFDETQLAEAGARGDPPAALARFEELCSVLSALTREPTERPHPDALADALDVSAEDRKKLAEIVATPHPRSNPEVTRTVTAAPPKAAPSLDDAWTPPPPLASPQKPGRRPFLIGAGLGVLGAAAGFLLGRRNGARAERRQATQHPARVSFAGSIPKQVRVELDGERVKQPQLDETLEIEPGRHVLRVSVPGGQPREHHFTVQAGEHVVLVPLAPRAR